MVKKERDLDKEGAAELNHKELNRRDLFKKYGPYTAPLVVSMLSPQIAYGHTTSQVYSSTAVCLADTSGGHDQGMGGAGMTRHCGINPGGNAHMIG